MPFDTAAAARGRRTYLPRHTALVLDGAQGTVLSALSGWLWVTLERDPRAIVLLEGMRFAIDRRGRTVIVAEEDSQLRVVRGPSAGEHVLARARSAAARMIRGWPLRLSRTPVPYC